EAWLQCAMRLAEVSAQCGKPAASAARQAVELPSHEGLGERGPPFACAGPAARNHRNRIGGSPGVRAATVMLTRFHSIPRFALPYSPGDLAAAVWAGLRGRLSGQA